MKYKNWIYISLLLLIIFCYSCEKTFFTDPEFDRAKIVLNGVIDPDYGIWVNLSKSVPVNRGAGHALNFITTADISFYEDGVMMGTLEHNANGDYYNTEFVPQAGHTYNIVAEADGYDNAETTIVIPHKVEIEDHSYEAITREISSAWGPYTTTDFYINLSFNDPDTIGNYYMIAAYFWDENHYEPLWISSEDDDMDMHIDDGINVMAMNDRGFNGQLQEYTFNFHMHLQEGFETRILVQLHSIEESYYKYLKTYSQNFTILNENNLISEAVDVHTNIRGGLGIMAAVYDDAFYFDYTFED